MKASVKKIEASFGDHVVVEFPEFRTSYQRHLSLAIYLPKITISKIDHHDMLKRLLAQEDYDSLTNYVDLYHDTQARLSRLRTKKKWYSSIIESETIPTDLQYLFADDQEHKSNALNVRECLTVSKIVCKIHALVTAKPKSDELSQSLANLYNLVNKSSNYAQFDKIVTANRDQLTQERLIVSIDPVRVQQVQSQFACYKNDLFHSVLFYNDQHVCSNYDFGQLPVATQEGLVNYCSYAATLASMIEQMQNVFNDQCVPVYLSKQCSCTCEDSSDRNSYERRATCCLCSCTDSCQTHWLAVMQIMQATMMRFLSRCMTLHETFKLQLLGRSFYDYDFYEKNESVGTYPSAHQLLSCHCGQYSTDSVQVVHLYPLLFDLDTGIFRPLMNLWQDVLRQQTDNIPHRQQPCSSHEQVGQVLLQLLNDAFMRWKQSCPTAALLMDAQKQFSAHIAEKWDASIAEWLRQGWRIRANHASDLVDVDLQIISENVSMCDVVDSMFSPSTHESVPFAAAMSSKYAKRISGIAREWLTQKDRIDSQNMVMSGTICEITEQHELLSYIRLNLIRYHCNKTVSFLNTSLAVEKRFRSISQCITSIAQPGLYESPDNVSVSHTSSSSYSGSETTCPRDLHKYESEQDRNHGQAIKYKYPLIDYFLKDVPRRFILRTNKYYHPKRIKYVPGSEPDLIITLPLGTSTYSTVPATKGIRYEFTIAPLQTLLLQQSEHRLQIHGKITIIATMVQTGSLRRSLPKSFSSSPNKQRLCYPCHSRQVSKYSSLFAFEPNTLVLFLTDLINTSKDKNDHIITCIERMKKNLMNIVNLNQFDNLLRFIRSCSIDMQFKPVSCTQLNTENNRQTVLTMISKAFSQEIKCALVSCPFWTRTTLDKVEVGLFVRVSNWLLMESLTRSLHATRQTSKVSAPSLRTLLIWLLLSDNKDEHGTRSLQEIPSIHLHDLFKIIFDHLHLSLTGSAK